MLKEHKARIEKNEACLLLDFVPGLTICLRCILCLAEMTLDAPQIHNNIEPVPTLISRRNGGERDGPALLDALLVGDADDLGPRPPEPQPPDLVVGVLGRLLGEGHSRQ